MVILSGAFNSLLATYQTKYLGISIVECVISNTILFAKIDISSSIIWYFKEISGMLKCYKIIEIFLYSVGVIPYAFLKLRENISWYHHRKRGIQYNWKR